MSIQPIRVQGSTVCHTATGVEQAAFDFDATNASSSLTSSPPPSLPESSSLYPSTPTPEMVALHSLVSLLTLARVESNRFISALISKYPKRLATQQRGAVTDRLSPAPLFTAFRFFPLCCALSLGAGKEEEEGGQR